jgi:SagB-type dehydrogenase family enzyme
LRAKQPKTRAPTISVRLLNHVTLVSEPSGQMHVAFDENALALGAFSAKAAERAQHLHEGVALASLASGRSAVDKEFGVLVRRLAGHGLVEFRLGASDHDQVVIEPQVADYWPRTPKLGRVDRLVLSRFAYMRRRGDAMVVESPLAGALFRIRDPNVTATVALLSTPQRVKQLRWQGGFPGDELLALMVDCRLLVAANIAGEADEDVPEGDDHLALWDFHDLLFHTRSTEGRQASPVGGTYASAGAIAPLPAVRPHWPGKKIGLGRFSEKSAPSPLVRLMQQRHSARSFDDRKPITLAELAQFLHDSARVISRWSDRVDLGDASPVVAYAMRPYPSAGASYELELYLAVDRCDGLPRGFYHYDAGAHVLVPIASSPQDLQTLLREAAFAMDAPVVPQILITIAARFGRVSWKYSGLAYALILKNVGVLTQTLYLMATDMGLGGCAIGSTNIDLFARMTGIEFHVEGPVGLFALGREALP